MLFFINILFGNYKTRSLYYNLLIILLSDIVRSNPIFALQVRLGPERTKRDNTPHTHQEHELIMCLEGSGWQLAEERRYQCRPGDLFILPAGQGHLAFSGSEEKMHVAVVMVHPETFSGVDDSMRETALILNNLAVEAEQGRNRINLSPEGRGRARGFLLAILEECERPGAGYNAMMKNLTQSLMLTCLRHGDLSRTLYEKLQAGSTDERVRNAVSYLNANFRRSLSVERAASVAGMSRSHFHASFLRHTGVTMSFYLNRLRTEFAIERLAEGVPMEEAARDAGFTSLSNFYRRFKEHSGHSPGYYVNISI